MTIRRVSRLEFEGFRISLDPIVAVFGHEIEWYADSGNNVLGVVMNAEPPGAWTRVVLTKDVDGKHRAADLDAGFSSQIEARSSLLEAMGRFALGQTRQPSSGERGEV